LFTGELSYSDDRAAVPPLAIVPDADDALRITYDGPLMRFPVLTPFLDLERGLASGTLAEGRVDLTFTPDRGGVRGFGEVRGEIVVGAHRQSILVRGVTTNRTETFMAQHFPQCRLILPDAPWGASSWTRDRDRPLALGADGSVSGGLRGEVATGAGVVAMRAEVEIALATNGGTLRLRVDGPASEGVTFTARLERAIPVRRPGRDGAVIETTFALVRVENDYLGWLEVSLERAAGALDLT
jgi:hypothetical protein